MLTTEEETGPMRKAGTEPPVEAETLKKQQT